LQYRHISYSNPYQNIPSANENEVESNLRQNPSSVDLMQLARDERKDKLYLEYYQQFNEEKENFLFKLGRNIIIPAILILTLIFIKSFYL